MDREFVPYNMVRQYMPKVIGNITPQTRLQHLNGAE